MSTRTGLRIPAVLFILSMLVIAFVACKVPVTPFEQAGCNLIQAADPTSGQIQKVCAAASEVSQIIDIVDGLRTSVAATVSDAGADGGTRMLLTKSSEPCTIVPTTNVCATNSELYSAILIVQMRRSTNRLVAAMDGGS